MKRLLSLLLATLMIVLSVPMTAFAEDDSVSLAAEGLTLTPGKNFFTGANAANEFSATWMQSWWTGGQMSNYLVTNGQRTVMNDGDSRGDYVHFSWDAANDGFIYGTHYPANDVAGYAIETDRPVVVGFYGRSSQDGYFLVGGNSESEVDYDFSRHCFFLGKDWAYYSSDFTIKDDASVLSNYWVRVGATVQDTAQTVDVDDVTIAPYYRFDYYVDGKSYGYAYVSPVNSTNGAYLSSASASQIEAPVKDGYTFVGWSLTNGVAETVDTVSLSNADVSLYAVFEENVTEPEPGPNPDETVGIGSPGINLFTTEENFVDFDNGDWQNNWWLGGQFQSYLVEGESRTIANDGGDRGDYLHISWDKTNDGILYAHYYPNGVDGLNVEDDRPFYVGFYAKASSETYVKFGNFSGTNYDGGDIAYEWAKHCLYVRNPGWNYFNTSFTRLPDKEVFQQFRISYGAGDGTIACTLDIDDMVVTPYYRIDYLVDGTEYNHAYVSPISVLDGTFISSTEADQLGGLTPYKSGYKFVGWSLNGENVVTTVNLENKDITLEAVFEKTNEEIVPDAPTAPAGAKVGDPGINMYNVNSIKYGFDKGTVGVPDSTVDFGTYGGAVSANVYLDGDNKVTYANIPSGGASHYARLQNYSFELARPITVCFDAKGSGTVNVLNYAADVQLLANTNLTSDWKTYSTEVSASEGIIILHAFSGDAYFDNVYIAANYKFNYYVGGSVYESVYVSPLNDDGTLALTKDAKQIADPSKPGYTFLGWSLTDGGEVVDEITLGCKDVNLYAVWNFEGTLPGMNVLTDDNTTFDFEDGNIGYVNFDGASQTVSEGVLSTQGNGAWYVYMNRSYYNLTGYGRPVAIAFKYKEESANSDDFVQIIGNGVWEGTQTYSPTTEWQSAHYLADTTNGANLSDPAFIIYAVAGSGKLCFDDFVLAPAYSFTYYVDGEEYKTEYISPLDENGDYRDSVVPSVEVPIKEGYKFVGWSASPAATEALDAVALNNEDVVLYAVYELDENYYLGDGMATAFDSKIKGPYGTLIYRQNFDDADSIKDYEYDQDYVSAYSDAGAALGDTSYVYSQDGDGSAPLFTLVTDPVSGVGKSLSMTGKTDYPIYRLKFDGNVLSKPGMYRFNFKSNRGENAVSERFRFYMNDVTNADTKTVEPSNAYWTEFPSHYGVWYTEEDRYKAAQQNFYPNNAFRVVTREEFDASGLASDEYTLDYVYSMNYFDVFLNMGNGKTLHLDDFEIWFEEYADVTFVLDGTDLSLDVTHRSFKPGSHMPAPNAVPAGFKFLGWTETEGSDDCTMVAKAGKYTLYPVVKSLSELDMENGLLGYEAIEDLDASGLAEINEVEYLPNVLEGDSFYDKAMALAKAGVIDADFSPYEYITDTELSAINNRFSGSEEKLSYTLKKNEDLMVLGAETEITADFITASDSYLASLVEEPVGALDMGIWLWGNYNTREYLRYDFTAKKEVEKAELEIHADNSFDIYVNGAYYPSYNEDGWYVSKCVDVTESTQMGVNKLGVRFFLADSPFENSNAMRASIKVTYTDGTSDTFKSSSDGKWRFYILCGHYENREPENWMTVDSIGSLASAVHLPLMYNDAGLHPREIRRSMYYRTDFDSSKTVKKATLYSASKGLYIPYINGERVDNAKFISGAMLDVSEYQAFDVTGYIQNGTNTIAAQTGNGWYNSENVSNMYWNKPLLMMQLEIEYTDGTTKTVKTDNTWKVTASPLYENDIQFGERYDARLEIDGWNEVGANTSGWSTAVKNTSSVPALEPQKYPASKAHEQRAVSMSILNDTSVCYDFGTNSAGRAKLVLKNTKAGEVVIVRYAEDVYRNDACTEIYGDVYFTYDTLSSGRSPYAAKNIDVYICKGAETEIFEPEFTYTGFRYIYVSGYSGEYTLDTVRKMDTYTDNDIVGTVETSNQDIMRLWDAVTRSYRSNIIGGPQDCPTREKNFWNGDIQVYVNTANWYMNNNYFLAAWTENGRKMQEGVYGWEDEEYIVPLSLYKYYENTDVLEAKYPVLLDIIAEREGHVASDGLPTGTNPYGYSPYNDHMSTVRVSSDFYAAAFFCRMYRDAAEIASILGKTADAENFAQKFEEARAKFNAKYYIPSEHDYNQRCQGGVVIPMAFGLVDESEMEGLAATLHDYVVAADYHQNSGFTSAEFLYIILCDYGYAEDAYKILTNETYPSLLYMLSTGATTMTERWDGMQPHSFGSANHYAFGSFSRFFFESLGGIKIDKPGFDEITIKPSFMKEIGDFKVTHESRHGLIESGWVYNESSDTYKWTVTVPEGVSATLVTPDGNEMSLTNTTETYTIGANGSVTGGLDINIGERQSSSNVRYAEIRGIQTLISENADNIFTVIPSSNMIVEIVEKTSAETSEIVTSAYYFVDASAKTYKKLSMDSYMTTDGKKSVRTKDPMGIRFRYSTLKSAKSEEEAFVIDEIGFIVAVTDNLGDAELTLDFSKYVTGVAYNRVDNTDIVFDSNDNIDVFTCVVKNIPISKYKTNLTCKTYTKITVDGEQFTLYGEAVTGNVYDTAKKLLETATDTETKNALYNIILDYDNTLSLPGDDLFEQ